MWQGCVAGLRGSSCVAGLRGRAVWQGFVAAAASQQLCSRAASQQLCGRAVLQRTHVPSGSRLVIMFMMESKNSAYSSASIELVHRSAS